MLAYLVSISMSVTGASGVGPRCRAPVSVGIGRCGQCRLAGRASESGADQRPSDRVIAILVAV